MGNIIHHALCEVNHLHMNDLCQLIEGLGIDWLDYDKDELESQLDVAKKYAKSVK